MKLVADAAGFSDAIQTSNRDIGVVMRYQQKTVPSGGSFHTEVVNGLGSANLDFAQIKQVGSNLKEGYFCGNGVLTLMLYHDVSALAFPILIPERSRLLVWASL